MKKTKLLQLPAVCSFLLSRYFAPHSTQNVELAGSSSNKTQSTTIESTSQGAAAQTLPQTPDIEVPEAQSAPAPPKRRVHWKQDTDLVQVKFYDLDEEERNDKRRMQIACWH